MITGYSPRNRNLAVYIMPDFTNFESLMAKLGKYETGKSCLYIKCLSDVDGDVLERHVNASVRYMRRHYQTR